MNYIYLKLSFNFFVQPHQVQNPVILITRNFDNEIQTNWEDLGSIRYSGSTPIVEQVVKLFNTGKQSLKMSLLYRSSSKKPLEKRSAFIETK